MSKKFDLKRTKSKIEKWKIFFWTDRSRMSTKEKFTSNNIENKF